MFEKKTRRFKIKEEQNLNDSLMQVILDTETGVQYILVTGSAGISAITPLLNKDGSISTGD